MLDAAGDRPVIFRTVDIGGDKALPYLTDEAEDEENPAMGWRALRLALERDGLMKAQARALLEAAAGRTLNVMFPMVSEPWEFDEAHGAVRGAARLGAQGATQAARRDPLRRDARGAGLAEMLDHAAAAASISCRSAPTT